MRKRLAIAAFLCILTAVAAAQSGADITMPPNARQTGRFQFSNNCLSGQTFRVAAEPQAEWLRFEPATVNVGPDTSFAVSVTVNTTGNRAPGTYRGNLKVFCASCAASEPPCLQEAKEFAINLTVANVRIPGEFQPIAEAPPPAPAPIPKKMSPAPFTPPDPPRRSFDRFIPFIGGGLLVVGAIGIVLALRGLLSGRAANGVLGAESERHQVGR